MLCGCMYVCMYVHRKLGATEINNGDISMHRSKAYPLCVGLDAYAHFGLGTGIYFLQIIGTGIYFLQILGLAFTFFKY